MVHSSVMRRKRRPARRLVKFSRIGMSCLLLVAFSSAFLPGPGATARVNACALSDIHQRNAVGAITGIVEKDANSLFNPGSDLSPLFAQTNATVHRQQPFGIIPSGSLSICPSNLSKFRFRCKSAKDRSST